MLKIYRLNKVQNNYIVNLEFAGVTVRVEFTGGNISKDTPAKKYTNDKFTQMAIENSDQFKDGTFILEREIEEESDKSAAASAPAGMGTSPDGNGAGFFGSGTASASDLREKGMLLGQDDKTSQNAGTPDAGTDDTQKLEFDNLADALVYAAQNFNVQAESEPAVRKVFAEHGIKVTIHKG